MLARVALTRSVDTAFANRTRTSARAVAGVLPVLLRIAGALSLAAHISRFAGSCALAVTVVGHVLGWIADAEAVFTGLARVADDLAVAAAVNVAPWV